MFVSANYLLHFVYTCLKISKVAKPALRHLKVLFPADGVHVINRTVPPGNSVSYFTTFRTIIRVYQTTSIIGVFVPSRELKPH